MKTTVGQIKSLIREAMGDQLDVAAQQVQAALSAAGIQSTTKRIPASGSKPELVAISCGPSPKYQHASEKEVQAALSQAFGRPAQSGTLRLPTWVVDGVKVEGGGSLLHLQLQSGGTLPAATPAGDDGSYNGTDGPNLPGFSFANKQPHTVTVPKSYSFIIDEDDDSGSVKIKKQPNGSYSVTGDMASLQDFLDGITAGDWDSIEQMWETIRPGKK